MARPGSGPGSLTDRAAWLLGRLEKEPALDPSGLARAHRVEPERINSALAELLDRRLVVETSSGDGRGRARVLTGEGCRVFNRLVEARREQLAELWPEWSPEKREEVAELIRRLAAALVPEAKRDGANQNSQTLTDNT